MSLAEQSRFTQLKITGRLPTPKGVALEVINLTQRENAPNHEIVRLINTDAALSLRVIKAANVLLGYISRPVATVDDAVTVLGARALRQLVLGLALILDYRHGPCKQFDYGRFWVHSLLTAIAARHLARRLRILTPDEIFTVGLLGDIGRLALATVYAEDYGALLVQSAGSSWVELQQRESEQFGFDERELSEAILADIHFPGIFQTLVREYRQPETSQAIHGSREWQLLYLLHTASLLADVCMASRAERGKLVSRLRFQAVRLGVEADALAEVGDACLRDWPDWSALLGMEPLEILPFDELLLEGDGVAEVSAAAQHDDSMPATHPLRVLLVEDDRVMSALLESLLSRAGHTVSCARNGVEALAMIAQHRPQLIIADWVMPEMDGISLCRTLRETAGWQDVYFIVMGAQDDTDKQVEAFAAGVDDYLVKPLNTRILFARLCAAMRVVKLQEALQQRAARNL
ncbi:MAG: HDOD domain-containing protein [Gallionella sp.]|nr:HDOD domain-containing protein [Gallionella sp.]